MLKTNYGKNGVVCYVKGRNIIFCSVEVLYYLFGSFLIRYLKVVKNIK